MSDPVPPLVLVGWLAATAAADVLRMRLRRRRAWRRLGHALSYDWRARNGH